MVLVSSAPASINVLAVLAAKRMGVLLPSYRGRGWVRGLTGLCRERRRLRLGKCSAACAALFCSLVKLIEGFIGGNFITNRGSGIYLRKLNWLFSSEQQEIISLGTVSLRKMQVLNLNLFPACCSAEVRVNKKNK